MRHHFDFGDLPRHLRERRCAATPRILPAEARKHQLLVGVLVIDAQQAVLGGIGGAGKREVAEIVVVVAELLGLPLLGQLGGIEGGRSGQHRIAPTNQDVCIVAFGNVVLVIDAGSHLLEVEGRRRIGDCGAGGTDQACHRRDRQLMAETASMPCTRSRRDRRSAMISPRVGLGLTLVAMFSAASNATDSGAVDRLCMAASPRARSLDPSGIAGAWRFANRIRGAQAQAQPALAGRPVQRALHRCARRAARAKGRGPFAPTGSAQRNASGRTGEPRHSLPIGALRGAGDVPIGLFGRDLLPGHVAVRCPDWNNRMHDGAAGPAADMKSAAQLPHTSGHAGNADAGGKTLAVAAVFRRLQAMSIIPDDDVNAIAPAPEEDPSLRRCGVAMDIGQCLLHDAQYRFLRRPRELVDGTTRAQDDRQPRAPS